MTLFALMRKDWRVYRTAVVGGAALLLSMYVLAVVFWMHQRLTAGNVARYAANESFGVWLYVSASINVLVIALVAAIFGGMSFALERRERWADFLALLRPSRIEVAFSKLLVSSACLAGMWFVNTFVGLFALALRPQTEPPEIGLTHVAFPTMLFGVAWLFSTFLTSAAIAACVAIAAATLLSFGVAATVGRDDGWTAIWVATHAAWATGLVAFLVGTIYYVRRVAP